MTNPPARAGKGNAAGAIKMGAKSRAALAADLDDADCETSDTPGAGSAH